MVSAEGGYVSSGASETKAVGGRLSFLTAIRSFRLPTPKLTIRLAVAVKTQESRIPFNYKEFIMEESSNKSVSVRPVPFLT